MNKTGAYHSSRLAVLSGLLWIIKGFVDKPATLIKARAVDVSPFSDADIWVGHLLLITTTFFAFGLSIHPHSSMFQM